MDSPYILNTADYVFERYYDSRENEENPARRGTYIYGSGRLYKAHRRKNAPEGLPQLLLVKYQYKHIAGNEFLYSRLTELLGVSAPVAYLFRIDEKDQRKFVTDAGIPCTRVVGIEWLDGLRKPTTSELSYKESATVLSEIYLLSTLFGYTDAIQYGYVPSKGICAYDFAESFNVSDFIVSVADAFDSGIVFRDSGISADALKVAELFLEKNPPELSIDVLKESIKRDSESVAGLTGHSPIECGEAMEAVLKRFAALSEEDIENILFVLQEFYPSGLLNRYRVCLDSTRKISMIFSQKAP